MRQNRNEQEEDLLVQRKFGSEADVERLTGISRRTLQKDRLLGTHRFTAYKVCGKIFYDLSEVERIIRSGALTPISPLGGAWL
jgi:hypothetical protein